MKIINYGPNYEIYSDDLKTFDHLPAATYKVHFNKMTGFSLVIADNFSSVEDKIYGNHLEKINKVLTSYESFERSLGIILSGEKGMGKSLFVQLMAAQAIEKGIPVIIVNKPYKGIADFLDSIHQECLIIFDEFEKIFEMEGDGTQETQNDLLGLFDGTSQRKRLYAITVNKLNRVSEFMVSRTGRFHYHIRFDFPSSSEIEVYLKDKLEEQYHDQIRHVIAFGGRVKLNYDSLRAIAFELNAGYSFASSIGDLNILNVDNQTYDLKVQFKNGESATLKSKTLDLFSDDIFVNGYTRNSDYFSMNFSGENVFNQEDNMIVPGEHVDFQFTPDDDDEKSVQLEVESVLIEKHYAAGVNYKYAV